jgi:hypothetical protein
LNSCMPETNYPYPRNCHTWIGGKEEIFITNFASPQSQSRLCQSLRGEVLKKPVIWFFIFQFLRRLLGMFRSSLMEDVVQELRPDGLPDVSDLDSMPLSVRQSLYLDQAQIIARFRELAELNVTQLRSKVDELRNIPRPLLQAPPNPTNHPGPQCLQPRPRPTIYPSSRNVLLHYDPRPRPTIVVPTRPPFRFGK